MADLSLIFGHDNQWNGQEPCIVVRNFDYYFQTKLVSWITHSEYMQMNLIILSIAWYVYISNNFWNQRLNNSRKSILKIQEVIWKLQQRTLLLVLWFSFWVFRLKTFDLQDLNSCISVYFSYYLYAFTCRLHLKDCLNNPSIEGGWTRVVICTPLYIVFDHYASKTDQNGEFDDINSLFLSMICLRSVDSRYSKSISVGIFYKCANLRQNTVTRYIWYLSLHELS